MAVAANLLFGDTPLASPELALVDAELAAQLRRTLGPVEDSWPLPPARVEDASAESEKDAPAQLKSADDAGHAESRDVEQLHDDEYIVSTPEQTPAEDIRPSSHYPVFFVPESEEAAVEDSAPLQLVGFDEASTESDDDAPLSVGRRRRPSMRSLAPSNSPATKTSSRCPSRLPSRSSAAPTIPFSRRQGRNERGSRRRMQPFDGYASA